MRIAIFTEVFLPKIDGVVTRLTRTLDQLAAMGHEVMVFAPGRGPREYAGFPVYRLPAASLWPVYPEVKFAGPTPGMMRALRRFDPDVIHAVNPIWTAALGVFAAQREALPLVASFHTNVPEYTEALGIGAVRPVTEAAIRYLHNKAAVNLCTSDPMVDKARAMGLERVRLWPKAVDTEAYSPDNASAAMRERLTAGHPEAPLVTYIGRISKEKDLHLLPAIMDELPGARLAVVGGGPYLERLKRECDPQTTVFTGYLSGPELAAAFASGDAFCFPSATETLGMVALESFASGVPVVGTRAGGIPFVIEEGRTGFLVGPDDPPSAWAHALKPLLSFPTRRRAMGAAARAEAERWSWAESTATVVEAYATAISAPLYN